MMLEKQAALGNIIAHDVTFDDWMEKYAEDHTEWVEGTVIKWPAVSTEHNDMDIFFCLLIGTYLEATNEGILLRHPFVLKINPMIALEPDYQIILNERKHIVHSTMTAAAPDIVIEITMRESLSRDLVEKYNIYQQEGVKELWLIHLSRKQADFFCLNNESLYKRIELDNHIFHSTVLPGFHLDTHLLWQKPLPAGKQILPIVDSMLKKDQ